MENKNFEEIFNKTETKIKLDTNRVSRAWKKLGLSTKRKTNVLIGGTNGKGSVSAFLWLLLTECSHLSWGLFSSPHLISFCERFFSANGIPKETVVEEELAKIKAGLESDYEDLTFFEVATLLAWMMFEKEGLGGQIFEVGLGGRLDSTNIVDADVTIITSISRDHEAYLGSDLKGILLEKLGITRPGVPLIWGDSGEIKQEPETLRFLARYCENRGIPFYVVTLDEKESTSHILGQTVKLPAFLQTSPTYIKRNYATALLASAVLKRVHPGIFKNEIGDDQSDVLVSKLPQLPLPPSLIGRFQRVSFDGGSVLLDVCHNPNGVETMIEALQKLQKPFVVALSILRDKSYKEMIDLVSQHAAETIYFDIVHERALPGKNLATEFSNLTYADSFRSAMKYMESNWHKNDVNWIVCGSVVAVGKVLVELEKHPNDFTCEDLFPLLPSADGAVAESRHRGSGLKDTRDIRTN
ncbi:MAG: hypothetical protein HRU19_06425 [Pseudobacteriovorax sp.]|nr:hypothetical protein [Pseudobacteriovorax sp.]